MRLGGQYVAKAPPMIHFSGMGPQKRESSEHSRLSPIMNQWPAGILMGVSKSAGAPVGQLSWMNGSAWRLPLRTT